MSCPVTGCPKPVQSHGVFCTDHYFRLPKKQAGLIFQMSFRMERAATQTDRDYFAGQREGYIAQAVRTLQCQETTHVK